MNKYRVFNKYFGKINNYYFIFYEIIYSYVFFKPKMKILFSKYNDDWEKLLSYSFKFSKHDFFFKDIKLENIEKYDLVIPLQISDLKYINTIKTINNSKKTIFVSSTKSIEICDDKFLFNNKLIEKGFAKYIPEMWNKENYPYILKKKIDNWWKNTHIILNSKKEKEFLYLIDNNDYFTQKIIKGNCEYATHIFIKDWKILNSLNIMYYFRNNISIKWKDNVYMEKICSCQYLILFESILNGIDFNWLCCINYKILDDTPWGVKN